MKDRSSLFVQTLISLIVLCLWCYVQWAVLERPIPAGAENMVMRALGILDAATFTVLTFWLGSSRGSARKDEVRAQTQAEGGGNG